MLKKNKSVLLVLLGVVGLGIAGGVTAYSLLVKRNIILGNIPSGSQLIPQDSVVAASISTDPTQWQQLRQYGTLDTQLTLNQQLNQLQQDLLNANGYNYQKDIQPWVGETVMIAYLPSTTSGEKQSPQSSPERAFMPPPDLIILPIENPDQAKQLFDKSNTQTVTQFSERIYKGIKIRETQKRNQQNYSVAALGRFLVVTTHPKTIEKVVDTYKGNPSLASTPGYSKNLSKISAAKPFAQVYFNSPILSALAAANSTRSLSPETQATQEQKQGIATTITLESAGIRFRSISWLKSNSRQTYRHKNTMSRLPRRLPANTLAMLCGGNLAQLWSDYVRASQSNPLTPISPNQLSSGLQTTLGLNLEQDLLPWMDGDFSLALIPGAENGLKLPENQPSPTLGAGLVLMVLSSDRARTEKALQHLDEVMQTRYRFTVERTQLNGQPVVNWTSPLSGVRATHGWLEGNIVFLTLGASIVEAIIPQPQTSLIQTPLFQEVVPTQPNPNNGQFFINLERIFNSSNLNFAQLPPQQKSIALSIRAIGLTVAVNDERSTRFDLFVHLKTTPSPNPSPMPKLELSPSSSDQSPSVNLSPKPQPSSP